MALGLQPQNLQNTLMQIHQISDQVWHSAGDQAVDVSFSLSDDLQFSWYTKRALVSKIYAVSEVYMMQDKSQDKQATWDFVERRISDVMQVGQFVNSNQTIVTTVATGV